MCVVLTVVPSVSRPARLVTLRTIASIILTRLSRRVSCLTIPVLALIRLVSVLTRSLIPVDAWAPLLAVR